MFQKRKVPLLKNLSEQTLSDNIVHELKCQTDPILQDYLHVLKSLRVFPEVSELVLDKIAQVDLIFN